MKDYTRNVAAGIDYLDMTEPGWRDRINWESLNLESHCNCILGQLYGDYYGATQKLDMDIHEAAERGFNVSIGFLFETDHDMDALEDAYTELTKEWKRQGHAQTPGEKSQ